MNKAPLPSPKSSTPAKSAGVHAPVSPLQASQPQPQPSPSPSHRPLLQRPTQQCDPVQAPPHERVSRLPQEPDTTESELSGDSMRDYGHSGMESVDSTEESAQESAGDAPQPKASPEELEVERLRNLQLKMLRQQRTRAKNGGSTTSQATRTRRISPIKEEPGPPISPTLEGAFNSPMATSNTTSTESTESAKTVRGSVPPTPAGQLRTPSYPFPTVPNTPKNWPSSFHQPFLNLSPTASALYQRDVITPREHITSETSTPTGSPAAFLPIGQPRQSPHPYDPRFPTPSLYDLVLQLGTEPGLLAWWKCVTTIMHDCYGAERATLAVPADASDIENVPWGQKTTFNTSTQETSRMADDKEASRSPVQEESTRRQEPALQDCLPPSPVQEQRPRLPSRHSFAGHERQRMDTVPEAPVPGLSVRPRGLRRAASHAPQTTTREHPLRQQVSPPSSFDGTPDITPSRGATFSDPEFSSIGGDAPVAPAAAVFPVLRALDHEPDALIDNTGVNRVLERGRLVTLTRDYSTCLATPKKSSQKSSPESSNDEVPKVLNQHVNVSGQEPHKGPSQQYKGASQRNRPGLNTNLGLTEQRELRAAPSYEEYEQYPTSPWAQSPAPSPAIQSDPDDNPFFSAGNVDEETFNPSSSNQDYSQFGMVEAIGVDKASTVTHIPLIHPTLSQPMQAADPPTRYHTPSTSGKPSERSTQDGSSTEPRERKAPIAILSFLSPIVPYPRNLTDSLKLLGPHLATSFSNAWQFTNAQAQATSVRNRRSVGGGQVGLTTFSDQESLDDLLHLNLENMDSSNAGSVTSPSDYSGRSKYSPSGSMGGTPGWDPGSMGFSSRHSVGNTPGHLSGSDAVESYFDAKKRSTRGHPPSASQENIHRKSDQKASRRASFHQADDDVATPRNEKGMSHVSTHDNVTGQAGSQRKGRSAQQQTSQHRAHSLLHSYGADFSSSFQSLPAATTPGSKPAGQTRGIYAEGPDMPPPSESLLRTIIDSLPVQIFTALPTTGALTWVNSKFLVYRGQDSRQVLQDPWDAIHPEDKEAYLEQWHQSLRTGQQLQRKVRLQRFDGHYRWFYVRVAPLKNKRQQIVHWIGTNMDFHEQHLAELNSARQQETAASEAKYRALANSSPQIVFVVSNRRGLSFCNSQWITYSGQSEAQAHGNGFMEFVHPDDIIKCKLPEMGDDGSTINVPTSMPPEYDRYRSKQSSSTPDGSLSDSSSSDGSSPETDKAVTSPGVSSPNTMEMPQAKLSKLASTGILRVTKDASGRASYSTEVRLRSKDGEYRWHLVRILLENALAEDGEEETWYGTATDINDHKLLEQTLKETMDAKTRFLSNMSHEIRTPLNGISGMVNFLLDSPLIPEQLEHVNIIKASTDSLLNLINDILDLSKVEAGMIKLDMGWLHLPSLLEEVNDLNMGLAIQKGLELNYLVDEGVPSMVKGDKFRIRQVLLNVVGNALKFTQKGEVFVRCRPCSPARVSSPTGDEFMVRFEVIDTGKGFNEEEAKYLFKRFSQIDGSSTRQHGGTGLGLAISMQFVELHGGKMDARSVPGQGSTFFFTIKFGLPTEKDQPPTPAIPGTPAFDPVTFAPPSQLPIPKQLEAQAVSNMHAERVSSDSLERSDPLKSPVPSLTTSERTRDSPYLSSGSSDPSVTGTSLTGKSSLHSERSSASSYMRDAHVPEHDPMKLALPSKRAGSDRDSQSDDSSASHETIRPQATVLVNPHQPPPMYSILVVCPLVHSREATIRHIRKTLPQGIPHQVTGQASLIEAQRMFGGDDPVLFTHVILVLHDTAEVIAIMDQILSSPAHEKTSIVVVSDPSRKKELLTAAPVYDYDQLFVEHRVEFIYRPLKPSKFAVIFDPQKERESSTDRNQDSAQQVVVSQKLVFEELKRRLGDKGHRVLLVEDNKINQTVILKFLAKISVETETVLDGVQCTEAVFSNPPGYYSIILCDLHMPNKDGYQACKEIRRWEKKHSYRRHPIIALSANVLGDVYEKCVAAGFNSYVTKPVEFKELSMILANFLDPEDPTKNPVLMKKK